MKMFSSLLVLLFIIKLKLKCVTKGFNCYHCCCNRLYGNAAKTGSGSVFYSPLLNKGVKTSRAAKQNVAWDAVNM